jgi:hypothetical protein
MIRFRKVQPEKPAKAEKPPEKVAAVKKRHYAKRKEGRPMAGLKS